MASRIEDYGLIGNTRTSALVSRAGAIDWLCGPRFDSDAWFAALVGYDEHGRWAILPTVPVRETRQRYRDDTMTLETDFICDGGAVRVTDFMPVGEDRCDVVRIVHGLEGEVPVEMLLDVRFGYGHDTPWVTPTPDGVSFTAGPDTVLLRAPIPTRASGSRVSAYLRMKEGDRVPLQLTWHGSHERAPAPLDVEQALMSTEAFWRQWARRCTYEGRWRAPVMRSLLTLKALAYAPTGAVVAAPTTSLPEAIGGVRNWDYRFCWMRDASLTIDAFMIGGYMDEARAFRDWALRATAGDPAEMQIMYDITGARRLTEFELPGCPATRARDRSAWATRRPGNSSSTSTARFCPACTRG
jgi:GH15 family glucan-1,4-alpha-glucosidase